MKRSTVSVIMPAYNVAQYIDEAIQSVLAQRGAAFELLIGDDGSADGTWDRIRRYRKDLRVRAWRFMRNRGAAAMRNWLVARARGRYVAICDADDMLLPGGLRRASRVLDRNPKVGVVYGDRQVIRGRGRLITTQVVQGPDDTWDLLGAHIGNGGTLIRRRVLRAAGGYRADLPIIHDYELFLRLAEITWFRHVGGGPLYCRRVRPGSLSSWPRRVREAYIQAVRRQAIARRYGVQLSWLEGHRRAARNGRLGDGR